MVILNENNKDKDITREMNGYSRLESNIISEEEFQKWKRQNVGGIIYMCVEITKD